MTYSEVARAIESYNRKYMQNIKERATMDYLLSSAIGSFINHAFSPNGSAPTIEQIYPTLFTEETQQAKEDISVARFQQFAAMHNLNFKLKGGGIIDNRRIKSNYYFKD